MTNTNNTMNKIHQIQKKIYDKAKYSNKKERFVLKEKHLNKLHEEVLDYIEEVLYISDWDKLEYIGNLMTIGLIEEVLDVLKEKRFLKDD